MNHTKACMIHACRRWQKPAIFILLRGMILINELNYLIASLPDLHNNVTIRW